ncbi:MAG TPA: GNAT family N-acetyltransferase [Solirubrobacteraceae bacterium]|nr:GNAT family N-acetyltransferase [Solirubrobacteraceae bacterium]
MPDGAATVSSLPEIVNPVELDEVPSWLRALVSGFLEDPYAASVERWARVAALAWEPERAWGARDRGRWVATLRTERRKLTIPGPRGATRELPVNAVTNVTVSATHRRRGLMTRMLDDALRAGQAQGEAVSVLISAEWPIYGRFGYAPATWGADYVLHRGRHGSSVAGDLTRVRASDRDEIAAVGARVFAAFARQRAGQMNRDQRWWSIALGKDGFPAPTDDDRLPYTWVVHEGEDGIDGLAGWRSTRHGPLNPPGGAVEVWGLFAAGDAAYRDLWAYLSGLDLVDEIDLRQRPVDEPARWLLADGRTLVVGDRVDYLWLRFLDIEAALTARRYAIAGELVLDVHDDSPGTEVDVGGRYRLRADGEEVECARTDAGADLELSQRALASLYLGGVTPAELVASGTVTELSAGALERARLMFSTPRAPWNATSF